MPALVHREAADIRRMIRRSRLAKDPVIADQVDTEKAIVVQAIAWLRIGFGSVQRMPVLGEMQFRSVGRQDFERVPVLIADFIPLSKRIAYLYAALHAGIQHALSTPLIMRKDNNWRVVRDYC